MIKNLKNSTTLASTAAAFTFARVLQAEARGRGYAVGVEVKLNEWIAKGQWGEINLVLDNPEMFKAKLHSDIKSIGLEMARAGEPQPVCLAFGEAAFTRLDEVLREWFRNVEAAANAAVAAEDARLN